MQRTYFVLENPLRDEKGRRKMKLKTSLTRMVILFIVVAGLTAAASGQYVDPQIGSYYNYPYGYIPGPYDYAPNPYYYDTVPRPPIGSYAPYRPAPFPYYTPPPLEVIPQPYPYGYQPPLYQPYSDIRPYVPPSRVRPYYGRPYTYREPGYRPVRPYPPRLRLRLNVAPVGHENLPPDDAGPPQDTPASPPAREPNRR